MKISSEINSSAKFIGEQKTLEIMGKAGFDAWDLSMFRMVNYDWANGRCLPSNHPLAGNEYIKFVRLLKRIGEDSGMHCNQSHAPFPSCVDAIRSNLKKAIECTAEAGGRICVIHPCNDRTAEKNAEMFLELLPFAKECGVKIATENMWNWNDTKDEAAPAACSDEKSFLEHLNAVNDEYFVACLDLGHAEMRGLNTGAIKMIYALKDKLQALHIHDNDKHYDSHALPYTMRIDFHEIIKALKKTGYKGYFTLEADTYITSAEEAENKLKTMAQTAKNMANEFDGLIL